MSQMLPTLHGPKVLPATVKKYTGWTYEQGCKEGPALILAALTDGRAGYRVDNVPQPAGKELSPKAKEKKRAYNLAYGKARRERFIRMGLTSTGAPRKKTNGNAIHAQEPKVTRSSAS